MVISDNAVSVSIFPQEMNKLHKDNYQINIKRQIWSVDVNKL